MPSKMYGIVPLMAAMQLCAAPDLQATPITASFTEVNQTLLTLSVDDGPVISYTQFGATDLWSGILPFPLELNPSTAEVILDWTEPGKFEIANVVHLFAGTLSEPPLFFITSGVQIGPLVDQGILPFPAPDGSALSYTNSNGDTVEIAFHDAPEPSTLSLLTVGLAALGYRLRKTRIKRVE